VLEFELRASHLVGRCLPLETCLPIQDFNKKKSLKIHAKIIFPGFFVLVCCYFVLLFETGSHYIAQTGLDLVILLFQQAECWDYRHVPTVF
jgi:hypothetical protein